MFSGRAMSLDSAGELRPGNTGDGMTLFLFPNSDDPDVINEGGDPATEADSWVPVGPTGQVMALPAKGAFELETTEFVSASYAPNDLLASKNVTVTDPLAGLLEAGTKYTDHICGVVSRGLVDSGYGPRGGNNGQALAFWPVWLPPT
jgi:hypothetical protein